jgi:FAD/FMN-containing dehydrogenase
MRGAGGSFGIATSITVQTLAAPPTATIFSYNWHFTASEAAQGLGVFRSFVLPPEFGAEVVFTRGDASIWTSLADGTRLSSSSIPR